MSTLRYCFSFASLFALSLLVSCTRSPQNGPINKDVVVVDKGGPKNDNDVPTPKTTDVHYMPDLQTIGAYDKLGAKFGGTVSGGPGGSRHFVGSAEAAERGMATFQLLTFQDASFPPVAGAFGLDLASSNVNDSDLKKIAGLKNLALLNLTATQVGDAGFKELAACGTLGELDIRSTNVTDAGLKQVVNMRNLHTLSLTLDGEKITDLGLSSLAEAKQLKALYLTESRVISSKNPMVPMPHLTTLYLSGRSVTDERVKGLREFESLTELAFYDTNITDATLREVARVRSLTLVKFRGHRFVDEEEMSKLQRSLPKAIVLYSR